MKLHCTPYGLSYGLAIAIWLAVKAANAIVPIKRTLYRQIKQNPDIALPPTVVPL
jgi:hypothetical protein